FRAFFLPPRQHRRQTHTVRSEDVMIVVMKRGATQEMVARMVSRIEAMGLKAHVIVGTERTVVAAIGEKRDGERETLESYPEVDKVLPILAPYKVASREAKPEPTIVQVLDL